MKIEMNEAGAVEIVPDGETEGAITLHYWDGAFEHVCEKNGKLHIIERGGPGVTIVDSMVIAPQVELRRQT